MANLDGVEESKKQDAVDPVATRLLESAQHAEHQNPNPNPIDEKAARCESNSKSNSDAIKCGNRAQVDWDVELNKSWKELKKTETAEQQSASLKAEKAWMGFRDAEFSAISGIYNGHGTMTHSWAAFGKADVVKDRAIELENRADNDKNGSAADRINVPDSGIMYIDRLGQAFEDADTDLNKNYQMLMKNVDKHAQNELRISERAWLRFRDAEFESIDAHHDSHFRGQRIEAEQEKLDIVQKRVDHLANQLGVATDH